jgi:hypothetical protein
MTASRCALPHTQPSFSAKLIVPVAELIASSSPQVVSLGRYAGTGPGRTSYDRTELHLTPPDCFVPMWNRMLSHWCNRLLSGTGPTGLIPYSMKPVGVSFFLFRHFPSLFLSQDSRPQWTSTHQGTIHWMPVITQLWMNLNWVSTWFHLDTK